LKKDGLNNTKRTENSHKKGPPLSTSATQQCTTNIVIQTLFRKNDKGFNQKEQKAEKVEENRKLNSN
jgi:hypothetical protein